MDKLIVYVVKSSYQRDLCLPSLVIVYQVSYNKKRKGIKLINGKVGQIHVTKFPAVLDGEILPLHFEI